MNILVVHGQKIEHYPPVRSLIITLLNIGHNVTIITKYESKNIIEHVNLKYIRIPDNNNRRSLKNIYAYVNKRRFMRKMVIEEMKHNDLLWTTTDSTIRDLGNLVCNYRHVMQLMELIEDMPLLPGIPYLKMNLKKIAQRAYKVVVPEYNRAHIQKVWWNLPELPIVLPNKTIDEDEVGVIPDEVIAAVEKLKVETRKIIIYQGAFQEDRDLKVYAEAIDKLDGEYVLYLMGRKNDYCNGILSNFVNVEYLGFFTPPFHLLLTKYAHIGLVPYVPKKVKHNSILNALYCAPNKIFEFTKYGIPMLGNDVPGLTIPLQTFNLGVVRKRNDTDEIIELIEYIEQNYYSMSVSCLKYYASIDLKRTISEILEA